MAVDPFRFLGLAFATADLLFEVDADGAITFAAGAGKRLAQTDDAGLIGRSWLELFAEGEQPTAEALIAGLVDGERRGLAEIGLAASPDGASRLASLSAFRLPQIAPRISCAMTLAPNKGARRTTSGKLFDRAEFESAAKLLIDASRDGGPDLELGLIEFSGLDREKSQLSPADASALERRVAGALRAESVGNAATELGEQRFAVMRRKEDAADAIVRRLTRVLGSGLEPSAQTMSIDAAVPSAKLMRAVRFAIDNFLETGASDEGLDLSAAISASVQKAVAEAGAFGGVVAARQFKLVYQPVVSLSDGKVRHYETLIRFSGDQSPFATIRMAEELDIIEDLDLAVVDEVIKRLRADRSGKLCLAVNVSGRTIVSPSYIDAVTRLAKAKDLGGRLLFEITESAAITDFGTAQRHVQALQAQKFQVCLDDFGAGAASYAYLRQLRVDVVKIDGSYVRELTGSGRDDTMIRHLVGLCRELKVETVAEMVETKVVEDILRAAGVDYAQGWLYGQPTAEPNPPQQPQLSPAAPLPLSPSVARRAGAKEQWG